jgi:tetrahydrodipicolinate N-succinyltransferase
MVEVCTGVDVKAGVSVGMGALVQTGVFICVSDGAIVAVHAGEGVGEAKITRRATTPVIIKETQAMDNKTRTIASPK